VPEVHKIGVLRSNALGDYIFILPALDALRRAYPCAEIVLLGKPWHKEFLTGRQGPVDRVAVVPPLNGVCVTAGMAREDPDEVEAFVRAMQQEQFDLMLQMYGGGRYSNPFVRRLNARLTAGLKAEDAPPLDRWIPYVFYHPEVLRYLEVAALVGAQPGSFEPRLMVTRRDIAETDALMPKAQQPIAVLHPGGSDPRRRWPVEKFARVGDALSQAGARVAVTGTADESGLAAALADAMTKDVLDLCGRLSLNGLTGLLAKSAVVVSNDTGPLHLARAVGASTVGIYWVGNVINAGSLTVGRHRSFFSWRLDCPECGKNCTETSCAHTASFVGDVDPDGVAASACELFNERGQQPRGE
jgi:ADP-heptose:LPS heptosyltransferase